MLKPFRSPAIDQHTGTTCIQAGFSQTLFVPEKVLGVTYMVWALKISNFEKPAPF